MISSSSESQTVSGRSRRQLRSTIFNFRYRYLFRRVLLRPHYHRPKPIGKLLGIHWRPRTATQNPSRTNRPQLPPQLRLQITHFSASGNPRLGGFWPEQKLHVQNLRRHGQSKATGEIQPPPLPPQHPKSNKRVHEMGHQQCLFSSPSNAVPRRHEIQAKHCLQPKSATRNIPNRLRHQQPTAEPWNGNGQRRLQVQYGGNGRRDSTKR